MPGLRYLPLTGWKEVLPDGFGVSSCGGSVPVMARSILSAAFCRISSVTWAYTFNVVALDTWPMTVDNVFTSIPCSRALVAKVCRRS